MMWNTEIRFRDRAEAGRRLAERLAAWTDRTDVLILALPRGGVPVGVEIARRLHAPLDVFVVRKLGVPGYAELAMGAIASGGIRVVNPDVVGPLGIESPAFDQVVSRELREVERRERAYRGDRPPIDVTGRTVILVDDGIATGSTMRAAALALRSQGPARLILAAPVAPAQARHRIESDVDEFVCLHEPEGFFAISVYYDEFPQLTDAEVRTMLERAATPAAEAVAAGHAA